MNVTSLSFPYGESIQWFCADRTDKLPPSPLKEWLLAPGSLTKKLKTCCNQFEVKVLGEGQLAPSKMNILSKALFGFVKYCYALIMFLGCLPEP